MHDAITFDRRGVPAVAVLSEPFANTGRMMARTHKLPDYRFAPDFRPQWSGGKMTRGIESLPVQLR